MDKILRKKLCNFYIFIIGFSIIPLIYYNRNILPADIPELIFWTALAVAADLKPFRVMPKVELDMTMSFVVQFSIVIIHGTATATIIILVATFIVELLSKKPFEKLIFNVGQYGLSLYLTSSIFYLTKLSPDDVIIDLLLDIPAILISVSTYFLLNTFFISSIISLSTGHKFIELFKMDFLKLTGYFYCLASISVAVTLIYEPNKYYTVLIMILPLILADMAMRSYYSLQHEAGETLRALASTLDERDKYTFNHSVNVARYAQKIAEVMGLKENIINEIELAGQVHDLGKVGIPDSILKKSTKLTAEEYERIKNHPEVGYRLLKNLKPYKDCAKYVLYHHERFDGKGYPKQLSGYDIPLGARILAVADSYDAMTTDRPYREAFSQAVAVREMRKCSGTQFDPAVVEAFIQVLRNDYNYTGE